MNQPILIELPNAITLFIKREDLLHPLLSGNKFRKLKYNLEEAKRMGKTTLLTFGGAFSNHILAVAAAGKEYGFATIGVIRGEELAEKYSDNPTLSEASKLGMTFYFISREAYRNKSSSTFVSDLKTKFGDFYILPEGGTNALAIKGCEEILTEEDNQFTHVCCAVGTGGTVSGIINSSLENQKIIGISALKDDFLSDVIRKFVTKTNWEVISTYHFGGYGKVNQELIAFLNSFYETTKIPLDPIYTGKLVFGVLDLIHKNYFPEKSKILLIHTGGLQGIRGINKKLSSKKQIEIQ
jgi:1-aminocyclopropane-1-carboxylate deaminase